MACCLRTESRADSVSRDVFFSFVGCCVGYLVLDPLQCCQQSLGHVCNAFAAAGRLTSEGGLGTSGRIVPPFGHLPKDFLFLFVVNASLPVG